MIIYTSIDGQTKIDVRLEDETLWLTQAQMCELYQTSKSNVSEHIKHIFEEGELDEESVVRKFRTSESSCSSPSLKRYACSSHHFLPSSASSTTSMSLNVPASRVRRTSVRTLWKP